MIKWLKSLRRLHITIWFEKEPKPWCATKYHPLPSNDAFELQMSKTNIAEFMVPKGTK